MTQKPVKQEHTSYTSDCLVRVILKVSHKIIRNLRISSKKETRKRITRHSVTKLDILCSNFYKRQINTTRTLRQKQALHENKTYPLVFTA